MDAMTHPDTAYAIHQLERSLALAKAARAAALLRPNTADGRSPAGRQPGLVRRVGLAIVRGHRPGPAAAAASPAGVVGS